jgi:hypothetical protein
MHCYLVGSIYGMSSIKLLPWMLSTNIRFILLSSFRGEDFLEVYQPETGIAYGGYVC